MRIGEVAERAGTTTKALRYYEEIGLLEPPERTPAGYRDFADQVLDRLRFILAARTLGLTLGEIKGIIAFREGGSPPCSHVLSLIDRRTSDLDRRIGELGQLRNQLHAMAERGRSLSPDACSPDLICHILDATT